jgi:hypothetical protein
MSDSSDDDEYSSDFDSGDETDASSGNVGGGGAAANAKTLEQLVDVYFLLKKPEVSDFKTAYDIVRGIALRAELTQHEPL